MRAIALAKRRAGRHNGGVLDRQHGNAGVDLIAISKAGPLLGRRCQIDDDIDPLFLHAKGRENSPNRICATSARLKPRSRSPG
jgi:hypothetical protein